MQQFSYMPYGELLVEGSSVDLDYRFSAKETDRETGLSYFGARYYDPTAAVWLGTDPLWEIEPDKSFYNYCRNNPVKLNTTLDILFFQGCKSSICKLQAIRV